MKASQIFHRLVSVHVGILRNRAYDVSIPNTFERTVVFIKSHDFYGSNFVRLLESLDYERWVVLEKADHAVMSDDAKEYLQRWLWPLPGQIDRSEFENDESVAFDVSRRIIAIATSPHPKKNKRSKDPTEVAEERVFDFGVIIVLNSTLWFE